MTEGVPISFDVTASDPDGEIPALSTSTLPAGASFTDNLNGTGAFAWTPDFTQSGVYQITFYATDTLSLVDSEVVIFSIAEAGNQQPVLDSIGNKQVSEGNQLLFSVSASDGESSPALSTSALPGTAAFVDSGNGTGVFDWTPGFFDAGLYPVTFYATDDSLAVDSETITITVIESGNQAPVFDTIPDTSVGEGDTLILVVSATDPDGDSVILTISAGMNGFTFVDNYNGTGTFTYTPNYFDAGIDTVRFIALDDAVPQASRTEIVGITTIDVNQPPEFEPAGPFTVETNDTLEFTVTAFDSTDQNWPGVTLHLSALSPPANSQFLDNADNTGTFTFMPVSGQEGVDTVTFLVTDDGTPNLAATMPVEITVVVVNSPPVLDPIGPQVLTEGDTLTLLITASDPDGTIPSLEAINLPDSSTFVDSGNGSGVFVFTPSYLQAGLYNVKFRASDGLANDDENVLIQVQEAGNQKPIFDSLPSLSLTEGDTVIDIVSAHDPELEPITIVFDSTTVPINFTYVDSGNGVASFMFTPEYTQADTYYVDVIAGDGETEDTGTVVIEVIEAGNQDPTLDSISDRVIVESHVLSFTVTATDPDSTPPLLYTSLPLPGSATFDSTYGSGTFSWTTTFTDSGTYQVMFYAQDSVVSTVIDSQLMTITVVDSNRAPWISILTTQKDVDEGDTLIVRLMTWDDDGPIPILDAYLSGQDTLATNMVLIDSGNGSGFLQFTPDFTQGDDNPTFYQVLFIARDSADTALYRTPVTWDIRVFHVNVPPTIQFSTGPGPYNITEGDTLEFTVTATDADGVIPTLDTSGLFPLNATWSQTSQNEGTFRFIPGFVQAGQYLITFAAVDDVGATDTDIVQINVTDAGNQPPQITVPGVASVQEGSTLTFDATATDPEGGVPSLSTAPLPSGASFADNGNGTGTFDWTPDFTQSGTHIIEFYATDDSSAVDTGAAAIMVLEVGNQLPVLDSIGPQSTNENVQLTFTVAAGDGESIPALTTSSLPAGALFTDNGDGTGTFDWTPDFTQSGSYPVTFYATDDSSAVDSEVVTIDVFEVGNQPPVLDSIRARSTTEGVQLTFTVTASDEESIPSLGTYSLPPGATFVDNTDGTGTFDWTPDLTQAGEHFVLFFATDDSLAADSEWVQINVAEVGNQPPVLNPIGNQSTPEGTLLAFTVTASDIESIPALTHTALPGVASFVDNGDGTGSFDWKPNFTDAGVYSVTFYATDDSAAVDSEAISITVTEVTNPPVLDSIGDKTTAENVQLTFGVSATDPEGVTPTLTTGALPSGASFVDNGNGTGTFDWTPSFIQSGNYQVAFYASDGQAVDTEAIQISVAEAGNQQPVLDSIGPRNVVEGNTLAFTVTASDPESTPALTTSALPSGAAFADSGNGTGSFSWTPTFIQAGVYQVTFYATDDSSAVDSEQVTITVQEAGNHAPVISTTLPDTIDVFATVQHDTDIVATDPDLDSIVLSAVHTIPPADAGFSDAGDGTGTFVYLPNVNDTGVVYQVLFVATDVPGGGADTLVTHYRVNPLLRGDCDFDGKYTMNDVAYLIRFIDRGGPAPIPLEAGDVDGSGATNVNDVLYLEAFLYQNGPAPPQ
ncbi:MAG: Ig-like domain-containing protein [Candidatus Zixiibacteriota bacterium]